jgi:hypothetical protein
MLRQPVPCCGWAATAMDCWKVVLPGRPSIPSDREPAARGRGAVRRRQTHASPGSVYRAAAGWAGPTGRGRSPASAARRPRGCRQDAGERCRSVSRPTQALHPDRAQRPRPNEQHGQHRWSEGRDERPGAAPTTHCVPDGNGLCTAASRISDGVLSVWTVVDSDA